MAEWSDGRLDDLKGQVGDGFKEVNRRIDRVDARVSSIEDSLGGRIEQVSARIDKVQETMMAGFISLALLIVTAVGAAITVMVALQ